MCLLSYYPQGVQPNLEHLRNGAEDNRDGFGFAIATSRGELIVRHSLNAAALIDEFGDVRAENLDGPAMFHSRWGTGGNYTEYNCHPFQVGRDRRTVVGHNGVLFSVPKGEQRCDTRIFAEQVMPQYFRRLDRSGVQTALEGYLGARNKLVVITVNPRYRHQGYLFNERAGEWIDGAWHSNDGWKETPYYLRKGWWSSGDVPTITVIGGKGKGTGVGAGNGTVTSSGGGRVVSIGEYTRHLCEVCYSYGVDPAVNICTFCRSCQDCWQNEDTCQCYIPESARRQAAEIEESVNAEAEADAQALLAQADAEMDMAREAEVVLASE